MEYLIAVQLARKMARRDEVGVKGKGRAQGSAGENECQEWISTMRGVHGEFKVNDSGWSCISQASKSEADVSLLWSNVSLKNRQAAAPQFNAKNSHCTLSLATINGNYAKSSIA